MHSIEALYIPRSIVLGIPRRTYQICTSRFWSSFSYFLRCTCHAGRQRSVRTRICRLDQTRAHKANNKDTAFFQTVSSRSLRFWCPSADGAFNRSIVRRGVLRSRASTAVPCAVSRSVKRFVTLGIERQPGSVRQDRHRKVPSY